MSRDAGPTDPRSGDEPRAARPPDTNGARPQAPPDVPDPDSPQAEAQGSTWSRWRGRGGGKRGAPGAGPWRSAYASRDLTSGSIPRTLWFLAWPQYLESSLRIVDQIADLVWAGLFGGFRAIAGIGAAQQYVFAAFTLRMGADMAMRAMVSRAIGMGDYALANHVVLQAGTLTIIYCILLVIIGIFLTEPLLRLLGLSESVVELGAAYMRVQFVGQASIGFQMLTAHALAAAGDTITPMKAGFIARILKIALSPALMFGFGGLPAMGLAGPALATVIGHLASLVYLMAVLFRGTSRLHLTLDGYRMDGDILKQLLRLGWPAGVNGMERTLAQLTFGFLVAPFGDIAYAAFTVTRRVEMFAHMGTMGIGNAAGTMVGQSIGAGKPQRARVTVIWAAAFGLIINGIISLLMFLFPDPFLSLFAREPQFLDAARAWLFIMLSGYTVMGISVAMGQAFQQAGDPLIVMLVNLGTLWGVVPLAFVLSKATPLAELGVAWAMVIPMLLRPVAYIPYFLHGRWLRVRLFASEVLAETDPD